MKVHPGRERDFESIGSGAISDRIEESTRRETFSEPAVGGFELLRTPGREMGDWKVTDACCIAPFWLHRT